MSIVWIQDGAIKLGAQGLKIGMSITFIFFLWFLLHPTQKPSTLYVDFLQRVFYL